MVMTWDFGWTAFGSSSVTGIGNFSYNDSAAADNVVTHGVQPAFLFWPEKDVADELQSFNFEGFVDGVSIGSTSALPSFFSFSPDIFNTEIILALKATPDGDVGVGCILNLCSLVENNVKIDGTKGVVNLRLRGEGGGGGTTGLAEPGTLGLLGLGMLMSGLVGRRRKTT